MTLYFLDYNDERHKVKEGLADRDEAMKALTKDLKKRKPKFNSYYTRCWDDDQGRTWFDFGSHTEFYICEND